jgi:hypothetical protein
MKKIISILILLTFNSCNSEISVEKNEVHFIPREAENVLFLKMDKNWNDESASSNNVIWFSDPSTPSPEFSEGIGGVGNAASFDGVDDYLEVEDNADFDSVEITVSLWFKSNAIDGDGKGFNLFSRYDAISSKGGFGIYLKSNHGDDTMFPWVQIKDEVNQTVCQTTQLPVNNDYNYNDNKWHHVAVQVQQSAGSIVKIYLDGELITNNCSVSSDWAFIQNPIRLGQSQDSWWDTFEGSIDEVGVWNTLINENDIKKLYEQR